MARTKPAPDVVDIHAIFREAKRLLTRAALLFHGRDDPNSYDFALTQEYLRSVFARGFIASGKYRAHGNETLRPRIVPKGPFAE